MSVEDRDAPKLQHGGWNPWTDPPPREAVERSIDWIKDVLRAADLAACEEVIERGMKSFVEVGEALMRIRDERLYRETHGTFEDYCRDRWGMTPQHGGRQIAAAEVASIVEPIGSIPNEAVARELAPLKNEPEKLRAVWA